MQESSLKTVHFTLQGKGGVGKSFVSSLIAQHLMNKGEPVTCLDTDPVNATFSGYKAFHAKRVELMVDNRISERKFDAMMEQMLAENTHFVVDNGAASFIPMSNYILENNAIGMLSEAGKQVYIHAVVTGGQALLDTLSGLSRLAQQMPPETLLVVWLNEYFGKIEAEGKPFESMKAYTQNKDRIHGIIRIPRQTSDTFGQDIEEMLDRRLTFSEIAQDTTFGLMAKQRLALVQRKLFDQLALAV